MEGRSSNMRSFAKPKDNRGHNEFLRNPSKPFGMKKKENSNDGTSVTSIKRSGTTTSKDLMGESYELFKKQQGSENYKRERLAREAKEKEEQNRLKARENAAAKARSERDAILKKQKEIQETLKKVESLHTDNEDDSEIYDDAFFDELEGINRGPNRREIVLKEGKEKGWPDSIDIDFLTKFTNERVPLARDILYGKHESSFRDDCEKRLSRYGRYQATQQVVISKGWFPSSGYYGDKGWETVSSALGRGLEEDVKIAKKENEWMNNVNRDLLLLDMICIPEIIVRLYEYERGWTRQEAIDQLEPGEEYGNIVFRDIVRDDGEESDYYDPDDEEEAEEEKEEIKAQMKGQQKLEVGGLKRKNEQQNEPKKAIKTHSIDLCDDDHEKKEKENSNNNSDNKNSHEEFFKSTHCYSDSEEDESKDKKEHMDEFDTLLASSDDE